MDDAPVALAPALPLPQTPFYSVEYPGYVASLDRALETLPQRALDTAFRRNATTLELHMRPRDPFAHPIQGDVVRTSNLVLKVVKRKRKDGTRGEYTATVVGSVGKTARFRAMADYQYIPDPQHHIVKLRHALDAMDVDAIKAFRFMTDKDRAQQQQQKASQQAVDAMDLDGTIDPQLLAGPSVPQVPAGESPLGLLGPPLWSRNPVPLLYGYKRSPVSVEVDVLDQNGNPVLDSEGNAKKRYVNKARWKGYAPAVINFADSTVHSPCPTSCVPHSRLLPQALPKAPPAVVEEARKTVNPKLVQRVVEKLSERPVWTRTALVNQFSAAEEREMQNSKVVLPLCAYMFNDGPWRDTFVRLGYDPRQDPEARFYQRLYFRNTANEMVKKATMAAKKKAKGTGEDGKPEERNTKSHIFDGQQTYTDTAVFQLCDITDPLLKELIDDPDAVRETVDERDGWYKESAITRIKGILRRKFFGMLDGRTVTDADCMDLVNLEDEVVVSRTIKVNNPNRKLRPRKNNMAKGAERPEDAIANRLRKAMQDQHDKKAAQESDSDEYVPD
ncbi:hypothetical protein EXIGLDRAFT_13046 [Exidia glandulosa HHB12029]|uniref:Transcription factor IIIC subunit 5 HTH domain-containing protein n=1 Tax=Exidia glandulosa HHB12029 TaxID=1314781 RepID=A0A165QTD2_EXIGL|nr:hypothetical protein EXIGLDRAFT_13046 [Exidia glandulosa HHB12029]